MQYFDESLPEQATKANYILYYTILYFIVANLRNVAFIWLILVVRKTKTEFMIYVYVFSFSDSRGGPGKPEE